MSSEDRDKLVRRLEALTEYLNREHSEDRLSIEKAAEKAGVSRRTMYSIVGGWKQPGGKGRTLASLGFRRRALKRSSGPERSEVEKKARAHIAHRLARNPNLGTEALIEGVLRLELRPAPSRTTVWRWVDDIRRRRAAAVRFGDRIRVDRARIEAVDPEGDGYLLFGVVDVGSRLVLGYRIATARRSKGAYLSAVASAIELLRKLNLGNLPTSARPPRIEFNTADDEEELDELVGRWGLSDLTNMHPEEKTFGKAIVHALGERLGPFRLASGPDRGGISVRSHHKVKLPVVGVPDMVDVADRAVAEHNRRIISRYDGPESPEVADAKARVIALLDRGEVIFGPTAILATDRRLRGLC